MPNPEHLIVEESILDEGRTVEVEEETHHGGDHIRPTRYSIQVPDRSTDRVRTNLDTDQLTCLLLFDSDNQANLDLVEDVHQLFVSVSSCKSHKFLETESVLSIIKVKMNYCGHW